MQYLFLLHNNLESVQKIYENFLCNLNLFKIAWNIKGVWHESKSADINAKHLICMPLWTAFIKWPKNDIA